jgi:Domain of unknown function (DUF4328)
MPGPVAGTYEPLTERAVWAKRALCLAILADVAALLADGAQFSLVQRATWGGVTLAEIQSNDTRQTVVSIVQGAVLVLAAVCFLRWFRRAYQNVPAISAVKTRWTSGWAVGYWFVPIYSWIRPKQIADEIWRSADPEPSGEHRLVDCWWGAWILTGLLTLFGYNLSKGARNASDFETFTEVYLGSDVAGIAAGLLALRLVGRTTDRQHEQAIRAANRAIA